ncbi:superinfection immunity protein [Alkalibacillus sp. S2W]|uniref:superinfection immunity protein n=1 Tax=Alkalibacillus sp. S2W TaxID=3386553 RepID=UPI00398D0480
MTGLVILFVILGVVSLLLYLTPTFFAVKNQHPHRTLIVVANLLIGWTLVAWIGLLVWSMKPEWQF